MTVAEDIALAPLTTFKLGPRARFLITLETPEDVVQGLAFAKEHGLPYTVLAGGSNTLFTAPEVYDGVVFRMAIRGLEVDGTRLLIGAGEDWDHVVEQAVELGLSGIEAMSAIPGSAGATPIQNVGAYGQEICNVLETVETYDTKAGEFVTLSNEACGFGYRDSIFKREKRYIVTGITLRLSTEPPRVPDYPGVAAYFAEKEVTEPTLADIRAAIVDIRAQKLPDPKVVASVGSFFKNPFVSEDVAERLRTEFEKPVLFAVSDGTHKVGAGWLIDALGLKGKSFGNLSLYPNNALVIVNNGGATFAELQMLVRDIQTQVEEHFGITLEPEPVFI